MSVEKTPPERGCACRERSPDAMRRQVLGGAVALALAPLGADAADPRTARPQPGDALVYSEGPRKGQPVLLAHFAIGAQPAFAYPVDPASNSVRDGNRLNQVLIVRLDPSQLGKRTEPHAADGVVAYSAVCTHYGCQVTLLHENKRAVICNCHGSTFDAGNNGEIVGGPATRRLAILPLKRADGALVVAAGFSGRLGPPQE
jgi:rieske iron-sulfur protein